jgi:hypothetical protein
MTVWARGEPAAAGACRQSRQLRCWSVSRPGTVLLMLQQPGLPSQPQSLVAVPPLPPAALQA